MAIIRVEIDIDAQGNVTATPNPVSVAEGDFLEVHVDSNRHGVKGGYITIIFPGDPTSPFGYERNIEIRRLPQHCETARSPNPATWPEGVDEYKMSVSYTFNPTREVTIVVRRPKVATVA